jgi:hypothetical protein
MQVIAMMRKQSKMYAAGGKLKMVKNKDGEEVPFFAADGAGKMQAGGMVPKTKGYFKGGKVMEEAKGLEGAYGSLTGTPVPYSPKPGGGRGRGGKRRGGKG